VKRAARKASGRSPRRKAGRAAAKKPAKPKKVHFPLVIDCQEMRVTYTPDWSDGEFAAGHFEFRSPHKPPRRIPVSETGYLSHFAAMTRIQEAETPEAYARSFTEATIGLFGKRRKNDDRRQLSLF
jgi:hypothetical protein